ncbi:MAG TPA: hypothetical protein PKG56_00250 [Chitinophagaceae bacterium]|nr:hypothetical protein [Chitinophagales bacterium]HNL81793.1 hypothetical protein [Chitinophagaceae bacterium]HMW95428.1 hypothetical protein [Chitinophagales bacterium]HMY43594.1 hypothetical protein [Chitinophagales bacterium]HNB39634.1 hypothetical protein [Chitinophagales bacterium]
MSNYNITTDLETPTEDADIVVNTEQHADIFSQIKEQFGVELDEQTIKNIPDYRSGFEEYSNLKPLLEDEEFKQVLDFRKNGGSLSDFIQAQNLDSSKLSDEDLIKLGIKEEFINNGYNDESKIDNIVNAQFRKSYQNKETELKNRLEAINEELEDGEDVELENERDDIELELTNLDIAKNKIIKAQKEKIENQKAKITNNHKSKENYEAELIEKSQAFQSELKTKIQNLDTKYQISKDISLDLNKEDLSKISENILFQETMEDGKTPFVYLQGISSDELSKALYFYQNLDTIIPKLLAEKELEIDNLYNNRHVPQFKNKHIDTGGNRGKFVISKE